MRTERNVLRLLLSVLVVASVVGCDPPSGAVDTLRAEEGSNGSSTGSPEHFRAVRETVDELLTKSAFDRAYPWSPPEGGWPEAATLRHAVRTPPGFDRVETKEGSWPAFLRKLPVRLDRSSVRSYAGETVFAPAARVALLPVGDRDLQQCADAAIRLRAEYLWQRGEGQRISFHFTSGDASAWSDWAEGERFRIDGADVERVHRAAADHTRENFRAYLRHLFTYAGTRSLRFDTRSVGAGEPVRSGDVFVDPGSPGHAVVVLDVAKNPEGERVALLGQSFMPAQEFHVLESPTAVGGAWFRLPQRPTGTLDTPSWRPFERRQLRRFSSSDGG